MAKKRFMGIDPAHKGACTPMTKSTCTPHRKALAKRLKPGGDLYKGKKKQEGGIVEDPERNLRVASDSLTNANINNPWIQRYLQGNRLNIPDPYNPGSGKTSTHGLSYHPLGDNQAMIYPEIIQQGDSLVKMSNDEAREYAIKNKIGITTDLELAKFYSENGLIQHTMNKKQNGGKVGIEDTSLRKGYETGTPLRNIFNVSADQSDYAKLLSSGPTRNAMNRIRWANYMGSLQDYPEGQDVPSFEFNEGQLAEMKKRGLTREYIESWQPTNYPEEFGLGGWIKENKEGIFGGLKALAGGALMATGIGGPLGAGLLTSGIGGIAGEIMDGNSTDQAAQQQAMLTEMQPQVAPEAIDPTVNLEGMTQVRNQYAPTFCKGGRVKRKMPLGGTVDTQLVELEMGEPFRTPDGTIGVVKSDDQLSHANGGATMPLEVGTQILGKGKDPDTKKTYKEMGKKLAMQKKKYDKILDSKAGTYSMNAAKAMNAKIDTKFTGLFQKQERAKAPQVSQQQDIPRADLGGLLGNLTGQIGSLLGSGSKVGTGFASGIAQGPTTPAISGAALGVNTPLQGRNQGFLSNLWGGAKNFVGQQGGLGGPSGMFNTAMQLAPVGYNFMQGMQPAEQLNAQDFYNPEYGQAIQGQQRAVDLLSNRRANIDPMLEANRNAQAMAEYNARTQGGLSAGAVASNRLAATAQRMRGDQSAMAYGQNLNAQYLAQQAAGESQLSAMRAGLGQQRAGTEFNVANINQQAEAARRAQLGAGFTGLSDYAQRQQLMAGQQTADQQRLGILEGMNPFMKQWFPGMYGGAGGAR